MTTSDDSNFLDSLLGFMPGYTAYKDAGRWREDDRQTREFVAQRIDDCVGRFDALGLAAANRVELTIVEQIDRCRTELLKSKARVESAIEGNTSWLTTGSTSEATLKAIREHDFALVSIVDQLDSQLRGQRGSTNSWSADATKKLLVELTEKLDRREELLKQPASE